MTEKPNRVALYAVITACLFLQIIALTTRYEGVYDVPCSENDLADCGPSAFKIQMVFWSFPVEPLAPSETELNRYRLVALALTLIVEVATIATFVTTQKKNI